MGTKFILSILFALTTSLVANSQSVYQFKYKLSAAKDTVNYRSVFIRLYDGSGIVRTRYIDPVTRQDVLIEMDASEQPVVDEKGNIDSSLLLYKIIKQRTIWGRGKLKYDSLALIFRYNPASDYYEPSVIRSSQNYNGPSQDTFLLAKLMDKKELTRKFVAGFFSEDESYFKDLSYEGGSKGLPAAERNIKLHLVIVADTLDKEIAKACLLDIKKVVEIFDNLVLTLGIQKSYTFVSGKQFSVAGVKEAVSKIKLFSENDIVVFYYTGHGFRKREEREQKIHFPYMKLTSVPGSRQDTYNNSISISEIFETIKNKKARFNLVISDCCNEDVLSSKSFGTRIGNVKASNLDWSVENCRNLFLKRASILTTAADNGQRAAGTVRDGSYYTQFLKLTLESSLSRTTKNVRNWDQVLTEARSGTIKFAKSAPCPREDDPSNKCFQEPYYIIR